MTTKSDDVPAAATVIRVCLEGGEPYSLFMDVKGHVKVSDIYGTRVFVTEVTHEGQKIVEIGSFPGSTVTVEFQDSTGRQGKREFEGYACIDEESSQNKQKKKKVT